MNIKRSIAKCMASTGINQVELAGLMKTTPSTISRIMTKNTCHIDTLKDLAKVFNMSVSEFIKEGES